MIQSPGLTLEQLLDRAERLARRRLVGRAAAEARAYAADAEGRVTVFGFPVPADDAGRQALAALLRAEMERRRAVMSVLALEARVRAGGGDAIACLVLEGQQLHPVARTEVRLLAIERAARGRRITGLRRLPGPQADAPGAGAPAGAESPAPARRA